MSKNILNAAFGFLIVVMTYGTFAFHQKSQHLEIQVQELNKALKKQGDELHALQDKVKQEQAKLQSEQAQERSAVLAKENEIAGLQQQLTQDQQKLDGLKTQRAAALSQNSAQADAAAVNDKVQQDNQLLKNLEQKVKDFQGVDKQVNIEKNEALKQQRAASQQEIQQINESIASQKNLINGTQAQFNYWKNQRANPNQQPQITAISNQLQQQRAVLNDLQAQLQEARTREGQKDQMIRNYTQNEQSTSTDSQAQLRAQEQSVKNELQDLKNQQNGFQKLGADKKARVQAIDADMQLANQKVQAEQQALARAQSDLQMLQTQGGSK